MPLTGGPPVRERVGHSASVARPHGGHHRAGQRARSCRGLERRLVGLLRRVVALDGVFLAARGATLRRLQLGDPGWLPPRSFHMYDLHYSLQSHLAGLVNLVLPLGVIHHSKVVLWPSDPPAL